MFLNETNAHSLTSNSSGFGSGFSHPILGIDHFLVMLGIGVWGAQMGGRRMWSLPISFPLIMCIGAIISISNIFMFIYVEYVIVLSVIILGLFILLKWLPNEIIALLIISFFAVFHGYAHGNEIPKAIDPLSFIIGFVISTGLIHLVGILLGYILNNFYKGILSRVLGIFIFILGITFIIRNYF
jgi:urease accessory protein